MKVKLIRQMSGRNRFFPLWSVFTSQLGKKSSLEQIKKSLGEIRHVETEFCQGNTMRWGVAWTFDDQYNFPSQCQKTNALKTFKKSKQKATSRTPICISFDSKYSFSTIKTYLEKHLVDELQVSLHSSSVECRFSL